MSTGTITILVVIVILIIVTLFFLRKFYCDETKLSLKASGKVESEIEDLFRGQGGDVKCLGSGTEPVELVPGELNYIWCGFRPSSTGTYRIVRKKVTADNSSLDVNSWFYDSSDWTSTISLGDVDVKKVFTLQIPEDVNNLTMRIEVEIYPPGSAQPRTELLDFKVNKIKWFRNFVC